MRNKRLKSGFGVWVQWNNRRRRAVVDGVCKGFVYVQMGKKLRKVPRSAVSREDWKLQLSNARSQLHTLYATVDKYLPAALRTEFQAVRRNYGKLHRQYHLHGIKTGKPRSQQGSRV